MQITLILDHHSKHGSFKQGETIDVSEDEYRKIMQIYSELRKKQIEDAALSKQQLKNWGLEK